MPETLEKLPQSQQLETSKLPDGSEIINTMQPAPADQIATKLLSMAEQLTSNGIGLSSVELSYTRQQIESAATLLLKRTDLSQIGRESIGKIINTTNNIKTFSRK